MLNKCTKRRDTGAGSNHQQITGWILWNHEGIPVWPCDVDAITGAGVTQVVGSDTRLFLAADLVDDEQGKVILAKSGLGIAEGKDGAGDSDLVAVS